MKEKEEDEEEEEKEEEEGGGVNGRTVNQVKESARGAEGAGVPAWHVRRDEGLLLISVNHSN